MWLCFADHYAGFAVTKAKQTWAMISDDEFPANVQEFIDADYHKPIEIELDTNGKYPEILNVRCEKSYFDPDDYDDEPEAEKETETADYGDDIPF